MSRVVKRWVPIAIAFLAGLLVLLGYLFPTSPLLAYSRDSLLNWAVILAGFAFILGLFNILRVHGRRLSSREETGKAYSAALLLAAAIAGILSLFSSPSGPVGQALLDYFIGPLGASVASLVVFTLAMAAFRLVRVRRNLGGAVFIVVVVVALLGSVPLIGFAWLADVRAWLIAVPGMAGTRGLLLGVALGTVITSLRVILSSDLPHAE